MCNNRQRGERRKSSLTGFFWILNGIVNIDIILIYLIRDYCLNGNFYYFIKLEYYIQY